MFNSVLKKIAEVDSEMAKTLGQKDDPNTGGGSSNGDSTTSTTDVKDNTNNKNPITPSNDPKNTSSESITSNPVSATTTTSSSSNTKSTTFPTMASTAEVATNVSAFFSKQLQKAPSFVSSEKIAAAKESLMQTLASTTAAATASSSAASKQPSSASASPLMSRAAPANTPETDPELRKRLLELEKLCSSYRKTLHQYQSDIEQLNKRDQQRLIELETLRASDTATLTATVEKQSERIRELEGQNKDLEVQLIGIRQKAKLKIVSLQQQVNDLKKEKAARDGNVENSESVNASPVVSAMSSPRVMSPLPKDDANISDVDVVAPNVVDITKLKEEYEDVIRVLKDENAELKGQVETLKKNPPQQQQQSDSATEDNDKSQYQSQIDELNKDKASLQGQIQTLMEGLSKADERVKNLEDQLSQAKSQAQSQPPPTPSKKDDADQDDKLFRMEEALKDLRIQLASKSSETSKLNDQVNATKAELDKQGKESEEKIRKLKALLGTVNKNLTELRGNLTSKETEVTELTAQKEDLTKRVSELEGLTDNLNSEVSRYKREVTDEKIMFQTQLQETEAKWKQETLELSELQTEYARYKIRAHAALQTTHVVEKMAELESVRGKLEEEKNELAEQVTRANARVSVLELDLKTAVEHISTLETELESIEPLKSEMKSAKSENENLLKRIETSRQEFEKILDSKEQAHIVAIENVRAQLKALTSDRDMKLEQKLAEIQSLKKDIERLNSQLNTQRDALAQAEREIHRLRVEYEASQAELANRPAGVVSPTASTQVSRQNSFAPSKNLETNNLGSEDDTRRKSTTTSLADLLTVRDNSQPASKEDFYRTQIQHLTDLLAESEAAVSRLKDQESLLKDEIRKKDRDEKRSQRLASLEYLKNVVLRFLETGDKEKLLPVLSQLLELSPEEVSRLRSSISSSTGALSPISGFLSFG